MLIAAILLIIAVLSSSIDGLMLAKCIPQCQESCPLDQTDHLGAQPTTMKPIYDAALREAVRLRMSPPNGESV
ncbi:MAG: hypothetical protein ACK550_00850, partial [Synechococcaceae cyanobacterium]